MWEVPSYVKHALCHLHVVLWRVKGNVFLLYYIISRLWMKNWLAIGYICRLAEIPCRLDLGLIMAIIQFKIKSVSLFVWQRPLGVIVSHPPPNPPALPFEGERSTAVVLCLLFYTYNDYDIHNNTLPFHQHSLKPIKALGLITLAAPLSLLSTVDESFR